MRRCSLGWLVMWVLGGCGCGGGAVSRDSAIRACVTLASCLGSVGVNSCLRGTLPLLHGAEISCLASAGADCNRAGTCVAGQSFRTGVVPPCTAGGPSALCDGTNLVVCTSRLTVELDCAQVYGAGTSCMTSASGPPDCAIGTCSTPTETCDGSKLLQCSATRGLLVARDCALERPARTCRLDGTGSARCTGTGASCTTSRCDGSALIACANGYEARINCTGVSGASCQSVPRPTGGNDVFCGFATQCDPYDIAAVESCAGTVLTFCGYGQTTTLDCTSLGFSSCSGRSCAL